MTIIYVGDECVHIIHLLFMLSAKENKRIQLYIVGRLYIYKAETEIYIRIRPIVTFLQCHTLCNYGRVYIGFHKPNVVCAYLSMMFSLPPLSLSLSFLHAFSIQQRSCHLYFRLSSLLLVFFFCFALLFRIFSTFLSAFFISILLSSYIFNSLYSCSHALTLFFAYIPSRFPCIEVSAGGLSESTTFDRFRFLSTFPLAGCHFGSFAYSGRVCTATADSLVSCDVIL